MCLAFFAISKEEAEEKLKQLNDRLVAKFEEDLKIKIELITSDPTSRHQQALLEERQTNETYVSTIKERFAKASSLNDELIRSLKNLKVCNSMSYIIYRNLAPTCIYMNTNYIYICTYRLCRQRIQR